MLPLSVATLVSDEKELATNKGWPGWKYFNSK